MRTIQCDKCRCPIDRNTGARTLVMRELDSDDGTPGVENDKPKELCAEHVTAFIAWLKDGF